MNFDNCCGSAFSSALNAIVDSNDFTTRSRTRRASLLAERLHEQLLRVLHATARQVVGGLPHLVELLEHLHAQLARHPPERRHLPRDLLDLLLAEVLEDVATRRPRRPSASGWRPCASPFRSCAAGAATTVVLMPCFCGPRPSRTATSRAAASGSFCRSAVQALGEHRQPAIGRGGGRPRRAAPRSRPRFPRSSSATAAAGAPGRCTSRRGPARLTCARPRVCSTTHGARRARTSRLTTPTPIHIGLDRAAARAGALLRQGLDERLLEGDVLHRQLVSARRVETDDPGREIADLLQEGRVTRLRRTRLLAVGFLLHLDGVVHEHGHRQTGDPAARPDRVRRRLVEFEVADVGRALAAARRTAARPRVGVGGAFAARRHGAPACCRAPRRRRAPPARRRTSRSPCSSLRTTPSRPYFSADLVLRCRG